MTLIPKLLFPIQHGQLVLILANIFNDLLLTGLPEYTQKFLNRFNSRFIFGTVVYGPGILKFLGMTIEQREDYSSLYTHMRSLIPSPASLFPVFVVYSVIHLYLPSISILLCHWTHLLVGSASMNLRGVPFMHFISDRRCMYSQLIPSAHRSITSIFSNIMDRLSAIPLLYQKALLLP